jgi:hypothetical protein
MGLKLHGAKIPFFILVPVKIPVQTEIPAPEFPDAILVPA